MSPFIYDGLSPYTRVESPLTLPPPPSMMHIPAMIPPPPHVFSPAELKVQTVHHTLHYPVHNPAAVSNWWPKPNYGPIRMNTNWNPHSLNSMMYTNTAALTSNPYFMANPASQIASQYNAQTMAGMTGMGGEQGEEQMQGEQMQGGEGDEGGMEMNGRQLKYQGDGFENPMMSPGMYPQGQDGQLII